MRKLWRSALVMGDSDWDGWAGCRVLHSKGLLCHRWAGDLERCLRCDWPIGRALPLHISGLMWHSWAGDILRSHEALSADRGLGGKGGWQVSGGRGA